MHPILAKATIEDYPVIQNMARFYVYDMSRYCGRVPGVFDWACPENGLFECNDLKRYFEEPDRLAFFIRVGAEIAGFVLLNKVGTTSDVDWNVGEFFVLAKFQGTGVGQRIAVQLFQDFHGIWEVAAMLENSGAIQFWKRVITHYTNGLFATEQKMVQEPKLHPMVIYRFVSPSKESHEIQESEL